MDEGTWDMGPCGRCEAVSEVRLERARSGSFRLSSIDVCVCVSLSLSLNVSSSSSSHPRPSTPRRACRRNASCLPLVTGRHCHTGRAKRASGQQRGSSLLRCGRRCWLLVVQGLGGRCDKALGGRRFGERALGRSWRSWRSWREATALTNGTRRRGVALVARREAKAQPGVDRLCGRCSCTRNHTAKGPPIKSHPRQTRVHHERQVTGSNTLLLSTTAAAIRHGSEAARIKAIGVGFGFGTEYSMLLLELTAVSVYIHYTGPVYLRSK